MSSIVAILTVQEIKLLPRGHNPDNDESPDEKYKSELLTLTAMYDSDAEVNGKWAMYTPSADLSMTIDNPKAQGKFFPGSKIRVTLESID